MIKERFAHTHRLLQTRYRRHVETGDDRHQGIEVTDVEAFSGSLDPIFDDTDALLLFRMLEEHGEKLVVVDCTVFFEYTERDLTRISLSHRNAFCRETLFETLF